MPVSHRLQPWHSACIRNCLSFTDPFLFCTQRLFSYWFSSYIYIQLVSTTSVCLFWTSRAPPPANMFWEGTASVTVIEVPTLIGWSSLSSLSLCCPLSVTLLARSPTNPKHLIYRIVYLCTTCELTIPISLLPIYSVVMFLSSYLPFLHCHWLIRR